MESKLVTLAVLSYARAEVLQGRLEARGIESFLENEHAIRPTYPEGVKVRIRQEDVSEALPIALHLKEEYAISKADMEMLSEDVHLVLLPTDFSETAANAFDYAYQIAKKLGAELKLLHVFYDATLTPVAAVDSYAYHVGFDVDLQEVENKAKSEMDDFLASIYRKYPVQQDGVQITHQLCGGATEDSILTIAHEQKADLIVMGTHGIGKVSGTFFGSVTATIIDEAQIPVLTVPTQARFNGFPEAMRVLYATKLETTDYLAMRKLMRLLYSFNVQITCLHVDRDGNTEVDEIQLDSLRSHLQDEYAGYQIDCMLHVGNDIIGAIETVLAQQTFEFVALATHKRGLFEEIFQSSLTQKMLRQSSKPLLIFQV